jgi:hypothetical protein
MKEQLITFKTAFLAKENGICNTFNSGTQYVSAFYCEENDLSTLKETEFSMEDCSIDDRYFRPTQSLLQKWIRDIHKIHLHICYLPEIKKWNADIYRLPNNSLLNNPFTLQKDDYEDVVELGLFEALKLIKS